MAKYEEVMIGLKQGKYAPAYMLCGKESYYIDLVANYIENNILDEMAREFDQTIIYGKDLSSGDVAPVISAARGFAMMGGYKVIILKEAQNIKKWEALAMYMDNPQPSTILVFCYKYGSPDKRLNLFKNWEKKGGILMVSGSNSIAEPEFMTSNTPYTPCTCANTSLFTANGSSLKSP